MPTIFIDEEKRRQYLPMADPEVDPSLYTMIVVDEAWKSLRDEAIKTGGQPHDWLAAQFDKLSDHSDKRVCFDCGRPMEAHAPTFGSTATDGEPTCLVCGVLTIVEINLLDDSPVEVWTPNKLLSGIYFGYEHPDHPMHLAREALYALVMFNLKSLWPDSNLDWEPARMGGWRIVLEAAQKHKVNVLTLLESQFIGLKAGQVYIKLDLTYECSGCSRPLEVGNTVYEPAAAINGSALCLSCGVLRIVDTVARRSSQGQYKLFPTERVVIHDKLLTMVDALWGSEKHWSPASEGKEVDCTT